MTVWQPIRENPRVPHAYTRYAKTIELLVSYRHTVINTIENRNANKHRLSKIKWRLFFNTRYLFTNTRRLLAARLSNAVTTVVQCCWRWVQSRWVGRCAGSWCTAAPARDSRPCTPWVYAMRTADRCRGNRSVPVPCVHRLVSVLSLSWFWLVFMIQRYGKNARYASLFDEKYHHKLHHFPASSC